MNASGLDDYNRSFGQYDVQQRWRDFTTTLTLFRVICYVACVLGVPGNILSAVVWMRRHIASENSSAIYLAALAINDLVFQLVDAVDLTLDGFIDYGAGDWPSRYLTYLLWIASVLEPMLVLSFSVVRLIAIRRPLQVGLRYFARF